MKREFLIAVAVLVLAGLGAFALMSRNQPTPSPNLALDTTQNSSQGTSTSEDSTVVYTNSGFSPSELTVETGTTVTFINQSDLPMWTASDPHPVHTDYPSFDHRQGVSKGGVYEYAFEEPGAYTYHNHLSPQHTGIIVVE